MFTALDISTSALVAQRSRLNAIASNIANISTTHNELGEAAPYQPRYVTFQSDNSLGGTSGAAGVQVHSVEMAQVEPNWKYQPGHPDAVKQGPHEGYVAYPGIDMMTEMVDSISASRAYEANLSIIGVSKSINQQTLKIIA
jgi:flagellar basal-body rod protein FlgC